MNPPSVAVIVPANNAEATLPACLAAIAAMTVKPDEVIVFCDGATDGTAAVARQAGVQVICNPGAPKGPAHGRNVAAAAARADLLLFVDADVVAAPDALARLMHAMAACGADAAFGSYDDDPRSQRTTSRYANLRHHFVHQHSARDASTFWAGLGLIDRRVFLEEGGYGAERFASPSIEDIELGARLIAKGRQIRLVPEAQAKHWKDWSLWQVWHTDIVRRAYPWSCLLADRRTPGADLNLSTAERAKAAVAIAILLLLLASIAQPAMLAVSAAAIAVYLYLNRAFFGFLAERLSPLALVQAIGMHWCYHVYATTTFAVVALQTLSGLRQPSFAQSISSGETSP